MVALESSRGKASGPFRFRVSDSTPIPLRGHLLRLKLAEGAPSMASLAAGDRLRVTSPSGAERIITIVDHAVTGGRATQKRLERTRELDVVISREDGGSGAAMIDIGWSASGPVTRRDGEKR
jgi:hypothetical protein